MKIDVTAVLLDRAGEPMRNEAGAFTLREALITALDAPLDTDKALTAAQKLEMHRLALRIYEQDEPDLAAEEVVLLKARVGAGFRPLVVGRVFEMIDPAA